ncbi:MAG: aldo/keto reductase [Chloroflexota bacterium]
MSERPLCTSIFVAHSESDEPHGVRYCHPLSIKLASTGNLAAWHALLEGYDMRSTVFGKTGLAVSRLSMGCNRLGDAGVDPAVWPPIVQRALDLGVTFFDTANSYNDGRSEDVLAAVIGSDRPDVVIATKAGMAMGGDNWAGRSFFADRLREWIEGSLIRLNRQSLDMFMLHSPSADQLDTEDWADAIQPLRLDGTIKSWGISTHDHASGIRAIQLGAELLQLEYGILSPSAEDELLPLAQKDDVGIMVRTPLARGLLSGKFRAGETIPSDQQWRRPKGDALQTRLERVEQLRFLEREGQTMAQAALRWVLKHPAVHCVIPGARTVDQLEANVEAINGDLRPDEYERISELQREWKQAV